MIDQAQDPFEAAWNALLARVDPVLVKKLSNSFRDVMRETTKKGGYAIGRTNDEMYDALTIVIAHIMSSIFALPNQEHLYNAFTHVYDDNKAVEAGLHQLKLDTKQDEIEVRHVVIEHEEDLDQLPEELREAVLRAVGGMLTKRVVN